MKSLQAQFSICQPMMPCTASASTKTQGAIVSAVLIRICCLVMLTLQKNKPNTSRKNERVPFCLQGSQTGLGCHLNLDFLWPLTATTTGLTYWETDNKKNPSIYMLFCCQSSLLNRQEKFCHGKYAIWHTCPADDLTKKPNTDLCYLQVTWWAIGQ